MFSQKQILNFSEYKINRDWLYAPSTYLVDSFEPFVEEIYLPKVSTKPGKLTLIFAEDGKSSYSENSFILKKIIRSFKTKKRKMSAPFIDLRSHSPANFAHAIMIHLTLAICATEFSKSINLSSPVLVFPKDLPSYIKILFNLLGFETILTNDELYGPRIKFELESTNFLRGRVHEIIKSYVSTTDFHQLLLKSHENLPKKIFISRKDTRKLVNESDVEELLKKNGYKKIYLEDYPVLEQIALVSLADSIVAIHGAALGPLIFRVLFDIPPLNIIEIYSPAHMTNVYRIITHQIKGEWVGVRGRAWPNLIKQAYLCKPTKVRQYSLNNFEVCLVSLKKAINKSNNES